MKRQTVKAAAATAAFLLLGCATTASDPISPADAMKAACVGDAFLARNGWLKSTDRIDRTNLWFLWYEGLTAGSGEAQTDKILSERRGAFENRLIGVTGNSETLVVVYELAPRTYNCMQVSGGEVTGFYEANCIVRGRLTPITQPQLRCQPA